MASDAKKVCVVLANEHCAGAAIDLPGRDESPNDRNDRAIRAATKYLSKVADVALVTDDAKNREIAKAEGLKAVSTRDFCEKSKKADRLKPLLRFDDEETTIKRSDDANEKPVLYYDEHLPMSELDAGLAKGTFFKGVLRCQRTCWRGSLQTDDRGVIFLDGPEAVNRSIDGDVVVVVLIDDDDDKGGKKTLKEEEEPVSFPETLTVPFAAAEEEQEVEQESTRRRGKVVGIVRRNWRQRYTGSLVDDRFFVPVDRRLPKIRIERRPPFVGEDDRVAVAIDSWPRDSRLPRGHYAARLGKAGDIGVETAMLLEEHDVATAAFSPQVLACLPPKGEYDFRPQDGRIDLRESLVVCSIDPPNCRDIDDALSCVASSPTVWEVGIHIADVTHFLAPETPLDAEASKRGTSTYLVDRRLDMLPKRLTEELCSLRSQVDRFAFSVFVNLDTKTGDIVGDPRFAKTLIRSRAALTYHEAQLMLNDDEDNDDASSVSSSVRRLAKLARMLRKRRFEKGALSLASPEVKFELSNESDSPTDVGAYKLVEANATVEEFMLLANICVASQILKVFPGLALLRNHPEPPAYRFSPLLEKARIGADGAQIDPTSNATLAKSLDEATTTDPYLDKLLRIVATRCMAPARYFCSADKGKDEWKHYGLAAAVYTHFTSPIRRYADVVVHRLLAAAIGIAPADRIGGRETIASVTAHLNAKSKNAQYAARDSIALHTRLYFKDHPQHHIEARFFDVDGPAQTITVLVPRYGVEAKLRVDPTKKIDFPSPQVVTIDDTTYRVFDKVFVDIIMHALKHDPLGEVHVVLSKDQDHKTTTAEAVAPEEKEEEQPTTKGNKKMAHQRAAAAAVLGHLPIAPVRLPNAAPVPTAPSDEQEASSPSSSKKRKLTTKQQRNKKRKD